MSIADKLTAIANNVPLVFEAGKAAGGGGKPVPVEEADVNFWDYDGTLLYSYTLEEAQALTELPPAPMPPESFLVFQEWNWTLAQIKSWGKPADVGAIYNTIDNKTYLRIKIPDGYPLAITLTMRTWGSATSQTLIDWGDGNTETVLGDIISPGHEYSAPGEYLIAIKRNGYTVDLSYNGALLGSGVATSYLRKAFLGDQARCSNRAFCNNGELEAITIQHSTGVLQTWAEGLAGCRRLKHLNIPSQMTQISSLMPDAFGLRTISLPYGLTGIGYACFKNARTLRRVIFASFTNIQSTAIFQDSGITEIDFNEGTTTLKAYTLAYSTALTKVTLPQSLTQIDAYAIAGCTGLYKLTFKSVTPPTVANANAFNSLPASCIVEVPAASLDAYKAATNYGNIAAQMVGGVINHAEN